MTRFQGNRQDLMCLADAITIPAATTKSVSGLTMEISADVDYLVVNPFFVASATDAGITVEARFVGIVDGATWDTNPMICRVAMNAKGYNKGPAIQLPVLGYRKIKLLAVRNNSAAKTISGFNVRYRQMSANH